MFEIIINIQELKDKSRIAKNSEVKFLVNGEQATSYK